MTKDKLADLIFKHPMSEAIARIGATFVVFDRGDLDARVDKVLVYGYATSTPMIESGAARMQVNDGADHARSMALDCLALAEYLDKRVNNDLTEVLAEFEVSPGFLEASSAAVVNKLLKEGWTKP